MSAGDGRGRVPSPRAAGTAVLVVSALVGAIAAASIANPAWGIVAAVTLSAASVGVLAGILLLGRQGWSDTTWPPSPRDQAITVARARRQSLGLGLFLLAMCAVALGALVFANLSGGADTLRAGAMAGVLGVIGVACIVWARRPVPAPVPFGERPASDAASDTGDWLRLGADGSALSAQQWLGPSGVGQIPTPLMVVVFLPVLFRIDAWGPAIAAVVLLLAGGMALIVARRARRSPWIARDGSALRHANRELAASETRAVSLLAVPWLADATQRSLTVTFEGPGRVRMPVGLRKHGQLVLSDAATDALVAFIEASSIDLPRDATDPRGKFSRQLYPTHLVKEQAAAVVTTPPGDGDPLPVDPPAPSG